MMRAIIVVTLSFATSVGAAGFALPEQSARAVGTAGTGTAAATGGSSIYYNVGTLAFEDGISAEATSIVILPSFVFEPQKGQSGRRTPVDTRVFVQPAAFGAYPVADRLQLGLGAFSNFGLGVTWPTTFPGRFDAIEANLVTYTFNPTASYRLNDQWGVGLGVDVVRATVELAQQLNFVDTEGSLRLGGGTYGFGMNAGVSSRWLGERLKLGASWRSSVALNFHGRAHFEVPLEFREQLRDQEVKTSLTLPHLLSVGGSFQVTPRLRTNLDLNYTVWSSFEAIRIDFLEDTRLNQDLRRSWNDTLTLRASGEFELSESLLVRAGAGFDPSPSPSDTLSPSLPDADRVLLSVGGGYRIGNFSADVGYLLVFLVPRATTGEAFPAQYSGQAHLAGITVAFRQ